MHRSKKQGYPDSFSLEPDPDNDYKDIKKMGVANIDILQEMHNEFTEYGDNDKYTNNCYPDVAVRNCHPILQGKLHMCLVIAMIVKCFDSTDNEKALLR
jgi:hypothetical protein